MRNNQSQNFIGYHGVSQAENGIDRVFGRTPGTLRKDQILSKHLTKTAEICGGGNALSAHQAVDGLVTWQFIKGLFDQLNFFGKIQIGMIAPVAQDQCPAIANFS